MHAPSSGVCVRPVSLVQSLHISYAVSACDCFEPTLAARLRVCQLRQSRLHELALDEECLVVTAYIATL